MQLRGIEEEEVYQGTGTAGIRRRRRKKETSPPELEEKIHPFFCRRKKQQQSVAFPCLFVDDYFSARCV